VRLEGGPLAAPMALADRLRAARHAHFVGRTTERERFDAALAADPPPFAVLHVWGPGGVGKTALLRAFEAACHQRGVPSRYLDLREIDPSPDAFAAALGARDAGDAPRVLLLDTAEAAPGLDGWLRETFLPDAPESTVVVLAGRERPGEAWTADPGWAALVAEMPLTNLDADDARALLDGLDVPEAQREAALAFTRGHPLALALVGDAVRRRPDVPFDPDDAPDVVGALLRRFIADVPGPDHRLALEACALARGTTESLLAALVERPAAPELFAWLRGLSFVQEGPNGLFPHDLARGVIVSDLRWRHPEQFADLHARTRRYYTRRLQAAAPAEQQRTLGDYAFLYRDNPIAGPLIARLRQRWSEQDVDLGGPPTEHELPALRAMVAKHEGPEAARVAAYWFARQPDGVEVFRDDAGAPTGFLARIALEHVTDDDRAADPAVAAALDTLRAAGPLRERARALLFRFWMDAGVHQGISSVQSLTFGRTVWHYLATPNLAFSFFLCAAPHDWGPIMRFAGLTRLPAADSAVGGQAYEAYGHDWRVLSPEAWLDALAERTPDVAPAPAPVHGRPALAVMSRADFAAAVKDALKAYPAPLRMRDNPLLRSRLVAERAVSDGEADRIAALRALIDDAVRSMEADRREAGHARALRLTYLDPAPSQAVVAERLDLPFSTYRRHLGRAIDRVVEALWAQEVG